MTQKRLYLSLTVESNGQIITMPLTPLLLALWLLAAFPLLTSFCEVANKIVLSADMVVGAVVIGFLALVMNMEVKLCYS